MAKKTHARAPEGAAGTCRNQSRPQRGGPAWVRPFRRAHRAMNASIRMIGASLSTVARSERCAHRSPVRTSKNLHAAAARLQEASSRLVLAARELAKTNERLSRETVIPVAMPDLMFEAAGRLVEVGIYLRDAAGDVFTLQEDVLLALRTGVYIAEKQDGRRPRIQLAPRPAPVRAFLRLRQPRVADRIAPILRRRRWTPRPTAVRVPRRSLLGRAPPAASIALP